MTHLDLLVHAALWGFTALVPVSASGHAEVLAVWLGRGADADRLPAILHLATFLAMVVAARRGISAMASGGLRALSRPALLQSTPGAADAVVVALGAAIALFGAALLGHATTSWARAPIAVGLGLIAGAVALGSTAMAPRSEAERPTLVGAALIGIVTALSVAPGQSPLGLVLTALLWLGVRSDRAVELGLAVVAPLELWRAAVVFQDDWGVGLSSVPGTTIALALVATVASALVGASAMRAIVARGRLPWLAIYLVPVGLAMLAYARALEPR